jgi:hypothetical protein
MRIRQRRRSSAAEMLRRGRRSSATKVWRRAHLGDDTVQQRQIGLVGRGNDLWDPVRGSNHAAECNRPLPVIDPARLGRMLVLEDIDTDAIIKTRMVRSRKFGPRTIRPRRRSTMSRGSSSTRS